MLAKRTLFQPPARRLGILDRIHVEAVGHGLFEHRLERRMARTDDVAIEPLGLWRVGRRGRH
jgi:hypothetical protein